MKTFKLVLAIALFSSSLTNSIAQGFELQKVIAATKKAIYDAAETLDKENNLPKLKSVEISLETVTTISANGEVNVLVFSASVGGERTNTQNITISFKPNWDKEVKISAEKSIGELLKKLIVQSSIGIAKANDGKVPLEVESVEIEVGITIDKVANGEAGFDIGFAKLGVNADYSKSKGNTVKLVFSK